MTVQPRRRQKELYESEEFAVAVAERDLLCGCVGGFISEEQMLTASQRRRIYDQELVSICYAMPCHVRGGREKKKKTYISLLPLRLPHPLVFRLGKCSKATPEGGFCFSEVSHAFDVFVGEAAAFVLDQEGVFAAGHCGAGAGAGVYWIWGSRMHGCICGGSGGDGCPVDRLKERVKLGIRMSVKSRGACISKSSSRRSSSRDTGISMKGSVHLRPVRIHET